MSSRLRESPHSFHLHWEEMEPLVTGADSVLDRFDAEIRGSLGTVPE